MATIQNLVGANKIKNEWQKINNNFAALNSAKVEKSGDTMTGDLTIQKASAAVQLNATSANPQVVLSVAGVRRAQIIFNESAGNLEIRRYAADGNTIEGRIHIEQGQIYLYGTSIFRSDASPEGNIAASPGSICTVWSTAAIGLWVKMSGTGNTGWAKVATAA